jgi:CheY-like chemotaxis protein
MITAWNEPGLHTPAGRGQGLRVLVVEDYAHGAATLARTLRREGHQVRVAVDGPTALEQASGSPPDVILLDIEMRGTDGWEVARRLRERVRHRQPVILAVSGYRREADRLHPWESGIDFHLVQPVDPARLCELLRRFQEILGR